MWSPKPDDYGLIDSEIFWANLQPFLLSRGYKLRPRYEPGWTGSWERNGKHPLMCEDALANTLGRVIDAVRLTDNLKVVMKRVLTITEEISIARYLSSKTLLPDPRNRTVPILDAIPLPFDDRWGLLVMPFLRQFDHPPFDSRLECVEALRQMLEGLTFMHDHNVAHRDACTGNIMMDTTKLIPSGFHHAAPFTHNGVIYHGDNLTWKTRSSVRPMKYFFIDFGLSIRFCSFEERTFVTGLRGQNKTVPEQAGTAPYDPFKVDIYQLGGVVRELIETYHNLSFCEPLVATMMCPDPASRPTAPEALKQFEGIVSKLGYWALRARVVPHEDRVPTETWLPTKIWLPRKAWRAIRRRL